ncbi:MAG: murein biosynthesis integral membrane protein MurJ [Beijerinckiaceae bacterium]
MLSRILSVGGITLFSRVTGFVRDIALAAVLGAGPLADALVVAMRLPNNFRSIFAEGAFSAAYVPAYARIREAESDKQAQIFASRVQTILLGSQLILLAIALVAMPWIIRVLAPGFTDDPAKFDLAVALSRITFPYLLFVTLVTQLSGSLNAVGRFAAAAFAPVLLNLSMIAAMSLTFLFPTTAHAAAWGVCAAGVAELALLVAAAARAGVMPGLAAPANDANMTAFWRAFWPGVLGSSGVQIAMFADLILSTLLPEGGPATMYYADRIYQLPIGVIAVAAGTVLLPEMSRRIAAGDVGGAHHAQSRTIALTLALTGPCLAAFLVIPDLVIRAAFVRGAYTDADALLSGGVLFAYGAGLPAIVLIRSVVASFHARGDTRTPMLISFAAIAVNVALKIVLAPKIGAPGLAYATAVGAWINFVALSVLAKRRSLMSPTHDFWRLMAIIGAATAAMLAFFIYARAPFAEFFSSLPMRDLVTLAVLGLAGLNLYVVTAFVGSRALGVDLSVRR